MRDLRNHTHLGEVHPVVGVVEAEEVVQGVVGDAEEAEGVVKAGRGAMADLLATGRGRTKTRRAVGITTGNAGTIRRWQEWLGRAEFASRRIAF